MKNKTYKKSIILLYVIVGFAIILVLFLSQKSNIKGDCITSDNNREEVLFPFFTDNLWGFIDKNGKVIVEPTYGYASDFNNGVAVVSILGPYDEYGYLNTQGNEIAGGFCQAYCFSDGLGRVVICDTEYGVGYIDTAGIWVLPPQFSMYKNNEGNMVPSVGDFSEGLASYRSKSGLFGYMNKQGTSVISPQFIEVAKFSEGMAAVAKRKGNDLRWGYITSEGDMAIQPQFENCGMFVNGVALAQDPVTHLYGYINTKGEWLILPQFIEAQDFSEGLACVRNKNDEFLYINISGQVAFEVDITERLAEPFNNGYGVIHQFRFSDIIVDKNGKPLKISRDIFWAGNFHNGLARVTLKPEGSSDDYDCVASYVSAAKTAYINTRGDVVWEGDEDENWEWTTTFNKLFW